MSGWQFSYQTTWQWVHDVSQETSLLLMSFSNKFWMGKCWEAWAGTGKRYPDVKIMMGGRSLNHQYHIFYVTFHFLKENSTFISWCSHFMNLNHEQMCFWFLTKIEVQLNPSIHSHCILQTSTTECECVKMSWGSLQSPTVLVLQHIAVNILSTRPALTTCHNNVTKINCWPVPARLITILHNLWVQLFVLHIYVFRKAEGT